MATYRHKPHVVEAQQLTPDNIHDVAKWCGGITVPDYNYIDTRPKLLVRTAKGMERAQNGNYIIKDAQGRFFLMTSTAFNASYEAVEWEEQEEPPNEDSAD